MTTPRILPWHGTHEKMGLHIHAPSCMQSVCRTETDEQYTSLSMLPKIYCITAVRPAVRCLLRDPQHFINKQIFNLVGFNWLLKLDIQRQQCHVALCSCTWPWVTPSAGCLFKKTEKKTSSKWPHFWQLNILMLLLMILLLSSLPHFLQAFFNSFIVSGF